MNSKIKNKFLFAVFIILIIGNIIIFFISSKKELKDTIPPYIEVKNIEIYDYEEIPTASQFITKISEDSNYEIKEINIKKEIGTQNIEIIVTDEYDNTTKKTATLTIKEYKINPVFIGLTPLNIEVGNTPDLTQNVELLDQKLGSIPYFIDDTKVNYEIPGKYTIVYKAKNINYYEEREIIIKETSKNYMINNFPTYNQYPNYPNGCESIALYNLLKYYNIKVTPEEIVKRLKKGSGVYRTNNELYGGNPEIEFVGDPKAYNGYGVYQKPIQDVANFYKEGMIDYTGHSLNEVLNIVKQNIPVQVWVSINLNDTKVCATWTYKETGEKINWICDLHSVVIVGYNSKYVHVSDSYTGTIESYERSQFEKMFNLFGKRALYYNN